MRYTNTNGNTANNIGIELGETGDLVYVSSNTILTGTKVFNTSFTATSTSTEVRYIHGTGATGYWTNVTLKQKKHQEITLPISKVVEPIRLLQQNTAGVGYELVASYYGSAFYL